MRFPSYLPSDESFTSRERVPEEKAELERRVPSGPSSAIPARFLPLRISPKQLGEIRSWLSIAASPQATEKETLSAIESINAILKEIETT